jgi:hypothetical protein
MLKTVLLTAAVLAVTVLIKYAERAPAATRLVTSHDVQVVSEQTLVQQDAAFGRHGGTGKNGKNPTK